jgi:hypothetical protein
VLASHSGDILLRPIRKNPSGKDWLEALLELKGLEIPERSKELGREVAL